MEDPGEELAVQTAEQVRQAGSLFQSSSSEGREQAKESQVDLPQGKK